MEWFRLSNLEFLDLRDNNVSGQITPQIQSLRNLKSLLLQGNSISGPLPRLDLILPSLIEFNCNLAPYGSGDFAKVCDWLIAQETFEWSLKSEIEDNEEEKEFLLTLLSQVTKPSKLNWSSNLPLSIWNGVHVNSKGRVQSLVLRDVGLMGSIPPDIQCLESLKYLDLSNNGLNGPLPFEFANLSNIEHLHLDGNQIENDEFLSLAQLDKLGTIDLSRNEMTGVMPSAFNDLSALRDFKIEQNSLEGKIELFRNKLT
jgi:Leucine-rich repeat (LRR) protein